MNPSQAVADYVDSVSVEEVIANEYRKRLERAAREVAKAMTERDDAIVAAHEDKATLRDIAQHVGLSNVGVMKIIRRHGITSK